MRSPKNYTINLRMMIVIKKRRHRVMKMMKRLKMDLLCMWIYFINHFMNEWKKRIIKNLTFQLHSTEGKIYYISPFLRFSSLSLSLLFYSPFKLRFIFQISSSYHHHLIPPQYYNLIMQKLCLFPFPCCTRTEWWMWLQNVLMFIL